MCRYLKIIMLVYKARTSDFNTNCNSRLILPSLYQSNRNSIQIEEIDDILTHLYKIRDNEISLRHNKNKETHKPNSYKRVCTTNSYEKTRDKQNTLTSDTPYSYRYAQTYIKPLPHKICCQYSTQFSSDPHLFHRTTYGDPADCNQPSLVPCLLNSVKPDCINISKEVYGTEVNKWIKNTESQNILSKEFSDAGYLDKFDNLDSNRADNQTDIQYEHEIASIAQTHDILGNNKEHTLETICLTKNVEKKVANVKPFLNLFLEVLKNGFYYRFNILKLLEKPKHCYFEGRTITNPKNETQKIFLTEFMTTTLQFVKSPTVVRKTDDAIFTIYNKVTLKASRQQLIELGVDSTYRITKQDHELYYIVQAYNKIFTAETKRLIQSTNYNKICCFYNARCGDSFMIYRYYDIFVGFMMPLYEISVFFDKNLKETVKHLTNPPIPENFYTDCSLASNDVLFCWAIGWLYFFSNYCNMNNLFDKRVFIITSMKKHSLDFLLDILLLLHVALKYESERKKWDWLNDNYIAELKKNITIVFNQTVTCKSDLFAMYLRNFIECIKKVYSRKICKHGRSKIMRLIRTTEEHEQFSSKLEEYLRPIINELASMCKEANEINILSFGF